MCFSNWTALHLLLFESKLFHCYNWSASVFSQLRLCVVPSEGASWFLLDSDLSFPLTDAAAYLFCVAETNQEILAVSISICFILWILLLAHWTCGWSWDQDECIGSAYANGITTVPQNVYWVYNKILYTQLIVFFCTKKISTKASKRYEESIAQNLDICQHNKNNFLLGWERHAPPSATTKPKSAESKFLKKCILLYENAFNC